MAYYKAAGPGSPMQASSVGSTPPYSPAVGSSSDMFAPAAVDDATTVRRRHASMAVGGTLQQQLQGNDYSRVGSAPSTPQVGSEALVSYVKKKVPALGSLAVGVMVGLVFAFLISGSGVSSLLTQSLEFSQLISCGHRIHQHPDGEGPRPCRHGEGSARGRHLVSPPKSRRSNSDYGSLSSSRP